MTDTPETPLRITLDGREYILAAEHERLLAEARNKALEDAAACCENEADKCDDAVKWGGERRYIQNCKAASFAMRNRAAAIRAMKGTW